MPVVAPFRDWIGGRVMQLTRRTFHPTMRWQSAHAAGTPSCIFPTRVCLSSSWSGSWPAWLAGKVMTGGGFGLIGDLIVGLIGAFIGDWLLPRLNIHLGTGWVPLILNAFIGAVVLLLILHLVGGRSRWGWRRRW